MVSGISEKRRWLVSCIDDVAILLLNGSQLVGELSNMCFRFRTTIKLSGNSASFSRKKDIFTVVRGCLTKTRITSVKFSNRFANY